MHQLGPTEPDAPVKVNFTKASAGLPYLEATYRYGAGEVPFASVLDTGATHNVIMYKTEQTAGACRRTQNNDNTT